MSTMDSTQEKLCRVLATEDPDEELWEWYRCPHCDSMKFYCENANRKAVYVRLRCMNCGKETKLKIGSNAEKKHRLNCNRKKHKRGSIDENE